MILNKSIALLIILFATIIATGQNSDQVAIENLSKSVKFKTISYKNPADFDYSEFQAFIDFLEQSYPLVHKHLERSIVNEYSLAYYWTEKKQMLNLYY